MENYDNLSTDGKPFESCGIRISSLRFSKMKEKREKPYGERHRSLCSNEFWNTFSRRKPEKYNFFDRFSKSRFSGQC
ncbi:hypothetical protein, partial [Schwartzia succinivorans]|uniref:hypothetical protein n=1 Tax=Schwartzia succinivorans TaxID=55507 RepID=UPI001F203D9D